MLHSIWSDRSGATAIEYGLIAALVAVAAITAMGSLGGTLTNTFQLTANTMQNAATSSS